MKMNDQGLVTQGDDSEIPRAWASRSDARAWADGNGWNPPPVPVWLDKNRDEPIAWVLGNPVGADPWIDIDSLDIPEWVAPFVPSGAKDANDIPPADVTMPMPTGAEDLPPQYCCAYHQALGISVDQVAVLQAGGVDSPLWRTLNAIKDQVMAAMPGQIHGEKVELEEVPDITVRMALLALPGEYDAAGAPLRFALVAHVPSLLTIEDESEYRNQVDEFKKFGTQIGAVSTLVTPYPIAAQNTWATINPAMTQPQAFSPARGTPVDLPNPSEFFNNRAG